MKRAIIIIGISAVLLSMPSLVFSIEKAPRISDREIVERLIRLETKIDAMDKRFEDINNRFEDINSQLNRMSAIFTALVIAVFGFAIWDRRTMIRPFETKVSTVAQ